jgi:hypothetical protein
VRGGIADESKESGRLSLFRLFFWYVTGMKTRWISVSALLFIAMAPPRAVGQSEDTKDSGRPSQSDAKRGQKGADQPADYSQEPRPIPETRGRLVALLGEDGKIDELVSKVRPELSSRRAIKLRSTSNEDGIAEFWVLVTPGPKVLAVKFISGDEQLADLAEEIRSAIFPDAFPDTTDVKLLRRGRLSCSHYSSECTFVLISEDSIRSVN